MGFISAHWSWIAAAAVWSLNELRRSIPAYGTQNFFKVWAYTLFKGPIKPPA